MLKRILFILLLIGVFGVVAVVAWPFYGYAIKERLRRQPFDKTVWQGQKDFRDDVRIRMVDDLLRRHDFHSKTRHQVTAVLGEPDETDYFKEWDMVYWLGPERGFMSIDSEWLVIQLDDDKKVTEYRIVRD